MDDDSARLTMSVTNDYGCGVGYVVRAERPSLSCLIGSYRLDISPCIVGSRPAIRSPPANRSNGRRRNAKIHPACLIHPLCGDGCAIDY